MDTDANSAITYLINGIRKRDESIYNFGLGMLLGARSAGKPMPDHLPFSDRAAQAKTVRWVDGRGMTAKDLLDAINEQLPGGINLGPSEGTVPRETRWFAAYAVKGGSEGYYVHLDAIVPDGLDPHGGPVWRAHRIGMGKFWSWTEALDVAGHITLIVENW